MKKLTNTWRLNNMLLNNQWINDQIKAEIKQYMEKNENNSTTQHPSVGHSEGSSKRKSYSNPGLFKEGRTISNE